MGRGTFIIVMIITVTVCLVLVMIFIDLMFIHTETVLDKASNDQLTYIIISLITIISMYVGNRMKNSKDNDKL